MIQSGTYLEVADNTGVKLVKCVGVLGGSRKKIGGYNDVIVVSVRKVNPKAHSSLKKGDVCLAAIVRKVKPFRRKDGSVIHCNMNAVVLLDRQRKVIGNCVSGLVVRESKRNFAAVTAVAIGEIV
jgi:large subunit ribosomal protein L14